MNIEYIVTTGISFLAFAVSCASVWYCRRNFKMSRYEFDKRRREEKQAVLKISVLPGKHGTFYISVWNRGKVEAKNITIDFGDIKSKHIHVVDKDLSFFPSLQPSDDYKIQMFDNNEECNVCTFQISVTWRDEYSKFNSKVYTLTVA